MRMVNAGSGISKAAVSRMPAYLRYLKGEDAKGIFYVSSAMIASEMGYTAVSVRKDLALVSSAPGKPRLGFEVKTLIADIEKFLRYDRFNSAVIVGAGRLGRAILAYEGFENYGVRVIAAFDNSPAKVGAVGGKPVYPMDRLPEIVKRNSVKVGILTVPRESAQSACNEMLRAGISAVLNFAPVYLSVPKGVRVKCEDLAVPLAQLATSLSESISKK